MLNGWKTALVSLAIVIFGALETYDFTSFLDKETAGIVTMIIGVIMYILRQFTKTPIFKSK